MCFKNGYYLCFDLILGSRAERWRINNIFTMAKKTPNCDGEVYVLKFYRSFDVVRYFGPISSKFVCDMISIWWHIDEKIIATPMPKAYQNKLVIIPHPLPCGKPHLSLYNCCCNWNKQKWITRLI
jgi:hypothetical protein